MKFKDYEGRTIWVDRSVVSIVVPKIENEVPVLNACEMMLKTGLVLHLSESLQDVAAKLEGENG